VKFRRVAGKKFRRHFFGIGAFIYKIGAVFFHVLLISFYIEGYFMHVGPYMQDSMN